MNIKVLISFVILIISLINCFVNEDAFKMLLIGNSATAGVELVRNYFSLLFSLIFIVILFLKFKWKLALSICVIFIWVFSLFNIAIDNGNNKIYYGITFIKIYEKFTLHPLQQN